MRKFISANLLIPIIGLMLIVLILLFNQDSLCELSIHVHDLDISAKFATCIVSK
ncbi:hypothetical protein [Vibrio algivorus]|uniref:hypothetical protein n=1 Tax=Vibrio algivorus TaxID=1667024 RepID=UPI0016431A57|nr:hypothetical protein [Vibrio algivorus]